MTSNINELSKIKTTLSLKKGLSFTVKFTTFILLLLNCANLYFAGVLTGIIIRWVNSIFNYTIPTTLPTWFCLYVMVLYLIILIPLILICVFLAEKLEDFEKYHIAYDIKYLRGRKEEIEKEISENKRIEIYNEPEVNLPINQIVEPLIPTEQTKILEPTNVEVPISKTKTLNKNQQSNEEKNIDSLKSISQSENEVEKSTLDKTATSVSQETDESEPINVFDNLNEIFVSKENIEEILDENEEVNYALPKISAEEYIDRNKSKQDIGFKGENFILKYERGELIKNNRNDLAIMVRHISQDVGDYVGYDILSYDKDGNEKCIEVKTSVKGYTADFFLTENEMTKIKKLDNYFIYRVFDFDILTEKGNLYIVNCKKDFVDYFTIQPTQYKVSPRKK